MIVPMRKATVFFETKDAESAIKELRRLGILHIAHYNLSEGGEVAVLAEEVTLINSALDILNQVLSSGKQIHPQNKIFDDWRMEAEKIIGLHKREEELVSSSRIITSQIDQWEPWGDVDPEQISYLRNNGIFLKLYQIPVKETEKFPDGVVIKTIFTAGDIAYCVTISRREFETAYPEIYPPQTGLSSLKNRLRQHHEDLETINREIRNSTSYYDELLNIRNQLHKEIRFNQVLAGMGKKETIGYVTGFIPYDSEEGLVGAARDKKWGLLIEQPSADDDIPTLVRNPGWVLRIRPVLDLLGVTPGYHELDVSVPFLIFFSIFFGILIGDAGYGLVYLLITLGMQKVLGQRSEMKSTISLFYILSSSAILWGGITGTFFGQEWLLASGYKPLLPQLNDIDTMQTFCFFLGALHLSIAHAWRAVLKYPSLKALAEVGWICILWTAFFLSRTLILGEEFPSQGMWLVTAGIALVIVFTNPKAQVFRGLGEGVGNVLLNLMNNLTDVISYIRLFAVGVATLAIAETTNTLAFEFGEGFVALVAAFFILVIGHSLNIVLGPMSVLVHGIRLNVLEFSGHAKVTWSGVAFEPFRE